MIILSDCFSERIDDGFLKVANYLRKKIKDRYPETIVISLNGRYVSDTYLKLNKLLINWKLITFLARTKEPILYIPFASNTKASCVRTFVLSLFNRKGVNVIFASRYPMDAISIKLLKLSKANIIVLSQESFDFFKSNFGDKVHYVKTGVDTSRFVPVDANKKSQLREKYGVDEGKKVLLHVGHLKVGRNIDKLLCIRDDYHVFIVVSSVNEIEKDLELRSRLRSRPSTTIIESYIENIEELYQLADVYFFPVQDSGNCIDVPLSVLEAASCNIPIVTTYYGELKAFRNVIGFSFIDTFEEKKLNNAIDSIIRIENINNRKAVLQYDWDKSIETLVRIINRQS